MGAGPVPEILHRALIRLAWLVRAGAVALAVAARAVDVTVAIEPAALGRAPRRDVRRGGRLGTDDGASRSSARGISWLKAMMGR